MSLALESIEDEIKDICHTLSCTTDNHPSMPTLLAKLGRSHINRFDLLGDPNDIAKAIEYTSIALSLTPDDDPCLPSMFDTLRESYADRFRRLGEVNDVEKAVKYANLACGLTPAGDPAMPKRLGDLGVSHGTRFQRLGDPNDVELAIEYGSRAIALTADDHSDLPYLLHTLGTGYLIRFQYQGELDDAHRMIEYTSLAVDLTPESHPNMPARLDNLSAAYIERYGRLGELWDLEKSFECRSQALALTPNSHHDFSRRLASLAEPYCTRFERLGELDDIDKAIDHGSRAITFAPSGHPELVGWHANLGRSYLLRFKNLGEIDDLERAIHHQSMTIDLTPKGHPNLPLLLDNIGVSYRTRSETLGRLSDLEKAIECQSRAISLTPSDHLRLPGRLSNIASSHTNRLTKLHDPRDLEKILEYECRALALTPKGHPKMSLRLNNLGLTHITRFEYLGDLDDLKTAEGHLTQARALIPREHPDLAIQNRNLARNYFFLHQYTGNASYCEECLDYFRRATQSEAGHPRYKFETAVIWTKLATDHPSLNPLEAYQTTVELLTQFIWLGATTNQRYQDLRAVESLAVNAAYTAIRYSKYALGLEWLEHARCVVWNQTLMLRSPLDELRSCHPDLASRFQAVSERLHNASFQSRNPRAVNPEQVAQEHHLLAKEYKTLLGQVQSLPGLESFLRPKNAASLVRAAKAGPIAVINCHEDQCDALLILPGLDEVQHTPLPKFSHNLAQYTLSEIRMRLARQGYRERRPYFASNPQKDGCFEDGLRLIWYGIVRPVLEFLGYMSNTPAANLPHITWCPTGPISFLPLHAAGDYDQPNSRVFDYVISSYTPTLTALLSPSPSSLTHDSAVLAVGLQHTPGHSSLPGIATELASIENYTKNRFQYTQLVNNQATMAAVLDAMGQSQWVHLACHAHQSISDPTKSGFFLHGGTLDLAAINRRSFKGKGLAFLSACQTATGDEKLPDEAVHLASGMLMAGYPSVIGTMWSVNDDDAPIVADKVYEQLMKEGKVGNGEAGKALHYAMSELRKEIGERDFARWMPYIHIGS